MVRESKNLNSNKNVSIMITSEDEEVIQSGPEKQHYQHFERRYKNLYLTLNLIMRLNEKQCKVIR